MLKVGITGSIGAGKSFLGALLRSRGFEVLDADCEVHELYRDSEPLRRELADYFGASCLTPDGVNRVLIADRVFADTAARQQLENIVYPYLTRSVENFFDAGVRAWAPCRFVEAALFSRAPSLVEMLDEVWIVDAPEAVRLRRLVARGLNEDDAARRIEDQRGACRRELFAGKRVCTIENDGDRSYLEEQVNLLLKEII